MFRSDKGIFDKSGGYHSSLPLAVFEGLMQLREYREHPDWKGVHPLVELCEGEEGVAAFASDLQHLLTALSPAAGEMSVQS